MQRSSVLRVAAFAVACSCFSFAYGAKQQDTPPGGLAAWQTTTRLNVARSHHGVAKSGNHIYAIGGYGANNSVLASVEYAPINSDGSVGVWKSTTALPAPVMDGGVVEASGTIYVAGGVNQAGGSTVATVYYAHVNADGSLGPWQTANGMLDARKFFNLAVAGQYVYAAGGYSSQLAVFPKVEFAAINADGSLGQWQNTTMLPQAEWGVGLAVTNSNLYAIGGYTEMGAGTSVYYAPIDANGALGQWNNAPDLPATLWNAGIAVNSLDLYVVGGASNGGDDDSPVPPKNSQAVYVAEATANGQLGAWNTTSSIVAASASLRAASAGSFVYAVGGTQAGSSIQPVSTVQYARIVGPQGHIASPPTLVAPSVSFSTAEPWNVTFTFSVNPNYSNITQYGFELTPKAGGDAKSAYVSPVVSYDDNASHPLISSAVNIAPTSTYGSGVEYALRGYVVVGGVKQYSPVTDFPDMSPIAVSYVSQASRTVTYQFLFDSRRIQAEGIRTTGPNQDRPTLKCDNGIGDIRISNLFEGISATVQGVTYSGAENAFSYSGIAAGSKVTCTAEVTRSQGEKIESDVLTQMSFTAQ